jgi:hypothetical protein
MLKWYVDIFPKKIDCNHDIVLVDGASLKLYVYLKKNLPQNRF